MKDSKIIFSLFVDRELEALLPEFSEIFGVNDFLIGNEQSFEWVESKDEGAIRLNIKRMHQWKSGNDLEPAIVTLESVDWLEVDKIVKDIQKHLNTEAINIKTGIENDRPFVVKSLRLDNRSTLWHLFIPFLLSIMGAVILLNIHENEPIVYQIILGTTFFLLFPVTMLWIKTSKVVLIMRK